MWNEHPDRGMTPLCHIFSAKGRDIINEWIIQSREKPNIMAKLRSGCSFHINFLYKRYSKWPFLMLALPLYWVCSLDEWIIHRVNHPKGYYSHATLSYIFSQRSWYYQWVNHLTLSYITVTTWSRNVMRARFISMEVNPFIHYCSHVVTKFNARVIYTYGI